MPGFGSLGMTELIIALVIILLLFGAKKVPELARGLGSGVREFRAGTKEGQLEDQKNKEKDEVKKNGEGPVAEDSRENEVKAEDEASVRAEKAEQKRS